MKIPVFVEVPTEKCKDCQIMELETQHYMNVTNHKCKHAEICKAVIDIWERARKEEQDGNTEN